MKTLKLLQVFLLLCFSFYGAQTIKEEADYLLINDSIKLKKGAEISIGKPYNYDFLSIEPVDNLKLLKKISSVAQISGLAGTTLGGLTSNSKILMGGAQVLSKANQFDNIVWTSKQISELNASNKAKKIVGKKFIVADWERDSNFDYYILTGKIDNKKYTINLMNGIVLNEISIK